MPYKDPEKNKAYLKEYNAKWYLKNKGTLRYKERCKKNDKAYYERNKTERNARSAKYYNDNRDELLEKGKEYRIANMASIRIKNRKYDKANRSNRSENNKKYYQDNPEKRKEYYEKNKKHKLAGGKLRYAVKTGRIIKPSQCERCPSTENIQGHHEDYDYPLDVIWLCRSCHARLRRK